MKYIKLFEEHSIEDLVNKKEDLQGLLNLGIISQEEYSDETRALDREIKSHARSVLTTGSKNRLYSTDWLNDVRKYPELRWLVSIIDSPEYRELTEAGLILSSSFTQLLNHTLVFSRSQTRDVGRDYAIGMFGSTRIIRRLVPKTGYRDMDVIIKRYPEETSELDFFKQAMSWAVNSIDFTSAEFVTKRTAKSVEAREVEQPKFNDLIARLVNQKLPNLSDSAVQRIIADLKYVLYFNYATQRRKNIKALEQYFNTDNEVALTVYDYSYNQLKGEALSVLSDPRIKIIRSDFN